MHGDTQVREQPPSPCQERHFSVRQIAELWHLSDDLVRKIFEQEPGVIAIGEARSNGRNRRYVTLRVPEAVLERVHSRLEGGAR
jgi:hypothetical protein